MKTVASWTRALPFVVAGLLLLAMAPMPPIYYKGLRIVVFIACAVIAWHHRHAHDDTLWTMVMIGISVMFNPILPIYLRDRSVWIPLDIS